jgi:hypothetical protein
MNIALNCGVYPIARRVPAPQATQICQKTPRNQALAEKPPNPGVRPLFHILFQLETVKQNMKHQAKKSPGRSPGNGNAERFSGRRW